MIEIHNPNLARTIPIEDMYKGKAFILGKGFTKPSMVFERDFDKMPNAHVAITGTSGSGKTTLVLPLITYYANLGKIVHVIDPKKDGMRTDGENLFLFTGRNSPYSVPVFEFDHHKENGGIHSEAKEIVRLLKKYYFPSAGEHQTGVLLQLIIDTYRMKGFMEEDDTTWDKGYDLNNRDEKREWLLTLPTMEDLFDNLLALIEVCKFKEEDDFGKFHTINKQKIERLQEQEENDDKDNESKILAVQETMIETYKQYVNGLVRKGVERIKIAEDMFKDVSMDFYNDPKVQRALDGLKLNLKLVVNSGVFGSKIPPVTRGVNRYDISGLPPETQCFITEIIANKLDRSLRFRGEYLDLPKAYRDIRGAKYDNVLVIDEAQLVLPTGRDAKDSTKGLIRIAAEGRGRGLALVLLTQSPNNIPEIMLRNIGTKIILKTEPVDTKSVCRLLGVNKTELDRIYDTFGTCMLNVDKDYETVALPWVKIRA